MVEQWHKEERETGRPSNKLWQVADKETMLANARKLLLGKDTEEVVEPVAPKKLGNAEGLAKWRAEQKALKQK
jgi:hypothetical protein